MVLILLEENTLIFLLVFNAKSRRGVFWIFECGKCDRHQSGELFRNTQRTEIFLHTKIHTILNRINVRPWLVSQPFSIFWKNLSEILARNCLFQPNFKKLFYLGLQLRLVFGTANYGHFSNLVLAKNSHWPYLYRRRTIRLKYFSVYQYKHGKTRQSNYSSDV